MDTLYIGDIPTNYCYARYSSNYIDLYSQPNIQGTLDYYRVYLYENYFTYSHLVTTYNQYNETTASKIDVSNDYIYRRDFPSIVSTAFIYILVIIFCLNIITSVFKKGGIFHGLL